MDEEDNERTLEALIDEYNVPNTDYEFLDSIECDKFKKESEDVDLDKKPAAQVGQSNILTLKPHQLLVSIWTQSSLESESLEKRDLRLLAGDASPRRFPGGKS